MRQAKNVEFKLNKESCYGLLFFLLEFDYYFGQLSIYASVVITTMYSFASVEENNIKKPNILFLYKKRKKIIFYIRSNINMATAPTFKHEIHTLNNGSQYNNNIIIKRVKEFT